MTRAARGAAAACAVLALAACGTLDRINEAGKIDYRSAAPKRPQLDVPPDLATPRGDERYALPDRPGANSLSQFERDRQAGVQQRAEQGGVLPAVAGVRVERAGNQRWLVVNQPPEKLWPMVREFWQESGFSVNTALPEAGIIETDWAENRAKLPDDFIRRTIGRVVPNLYSTPERDKFRTRLEASADGGTEIYISHRGMVEVYRNEQKDSTVWQPRPTDPELEAEFMRRLMVRLGTDRERAATAVAATTQPAAERATLAGGTLRVDEPFDRAWRRVGLALDRVGFTVEDRDRSQGVYFVRFVDTEAADGKRPGFFGRLFGGGDRKDATAQRYRIQVQGAGEASQVQVADVEGRGLSSEQDRRVGARILALLQEQLR